MQNEKNSLYLPLQVLLSELNICPGSHTHIGPHGVLEQFVHPEFSHSVASKNRNKIKIDIQFEVVYNKNVYTAQHKKEQTHYVQCFL